MSFRELQSLFGKRFWKQTVIAFSHWSFSEHSILIRNITGINEPWKCEDLNSNLQEKFHTENSIPCIFIDSWSQQPTNLEDVSQQEAFER